MTFELGEALVSAEPCVFPQNNLAQRSTYLAQRSPLFSFFFKISFGAMNSRKNSYLDQRSPPTLGLAVTILQYNLEVHCTSFCRVALVVLQPQPPHTWQNYEQNSGQNCLLSLVFAAIFWPCFVRCLFIFSPCV